MGSSRDTRLKLKQLLSICMETLKKWYINTEMNLTQTQVLYCTWLALKNLPTLSLEPTPVLRCPIQLEQCPTKKIALVKATTAEMDNMNGKMRKAGQKDDEDFFTDYHLMVNPQGYIEEFYKTQRCYSIILVPGTSLLGQGLVGVVYLLWLGYLFVGIGIISDIFMEAIESITSQTKIDEYWDDNMNHVTI